MTWLLIILCLLLGWGGAWFMSRFAYRLGLLDVPNDRSSHNLATPSGGGIGILAVFIVTSIWLKLSLYILLPAAFLALVSFFDDKLDLSPKIRLIFQFIAALTVTGFSFHSPCSPLTALLFLFFCIFIVGTANFYNFMDGINGIAGITGAIAFALTGFFAYYTNQVQMAISSWCMCAGCIGFLPLNVPRARVFMGDVGSVLLGFVFAVYIVFLSRSVADFVMMSGFLSTFYVDALTTLYVRKRDCERLSLAHRRHLYQLFANQKSVPHWKVSISYGIIQLFIGILLLFTYRFGLFFTISIEILLLLLWIVVMERVRKEVELRTRAI